jgi:hypothetical protein
MSCIALGFEQGQDGGQNSPIRHDRADEVEQYELVELSSTRQCRA